VSAAISRPSHAASRAFRFTDTTGGSITSNRTSWIVTALALQKVFGGLYFVEHCIWLAFRNSRWPLSVDATALWARLPAAVSTGPFLSDIPERLLLPGNTWQTRSESEVSGPSRLPRKRRSDVLCKPRLATDRRRRSPVQ
jgi:hypothetical protein